jgi:hypothetical protein
MCELASGEHYQVDDCQSGPEAFRTGSFWALRCIRARSRTLSPGYWCTAHGRLDLSRLPMLGCVQPVGHSPMR